jgi:hypothetical protein
MWYKCSDRPQLTFLSSQAIQRGHEVSLFLSSHRRSNCTFLPLIHIKIYVSSSIQHAHCPSNQNRKRCALNSNHIKCRHKLLYLAHPSLQCQWPPIAHPDAVNGRLSRSMLRNAMNTLEWWVQFF